MKAGIVTEPMLKTIQNSLKYQLLLVLTLRYKYTYNLQYLSWLIVKRLSILQLSLITIMSRPT